MRKKAIIVTAPSGAGKTSIVKHLLQTLPELAFSVSACSRPKRENETDGKDYYFITADEFLNKIGKGEFVEWQEVYPGNYYGTLKSEMDRIWKSGGTPIFDVDVIGALNLKRYFGDYAMVIFIRPPSVKELEKRLRNRHTEDEESVKKRITKSKIELDFAKKADRVVVNDDLGRACDEAAEIVTEFIS